MARRSPSSRRGNASENANGTPKPANAQAKKAGGSKRGAWSDPTPAQIEQSIRESRLPLEIALEIDLDGHPDGNTKPRLPLVECGVNSWQELVEVQRIIDSARRPVRRGRDGLEEEDVLEGMVFGSSSQELQLSTGAVNSVHRFARALQARTQSLGLSSRTLLGDRVLVRLPAMSAKPNSKQLLQWNNIVATPLVPAQDQPTTSIQRVGLPQVRPSTVAVDPLEGLRHPQLVAFVDELIAAHASTGRAQVVVLRGIPGSGKSTLGREVLAICEARGVRSVVCSADFYFETPRGYEFDVKAISKAHESCQQTFRDGLHDSRNAVVVVDNTNTTRWEYDGYEKAAVAAQTGFHILEMRCADVLTCIRMGQRNSHGVGVIKVMAMYMRWEPDDRARVFVPSFQDALVSSNPVTRNPVNNYVAYVGLFLDATARAKLLERVTPRHSNVIAEHITLFFRPTTQYIRQAPIGKKYKIRVIQVVEDDRGQAVEVLLDDGLHLRGTNKVNHITVSTAQGISAFYSNELLEDPQAKCVQVDDLELEVTLGVAMMAQNRKIVTLSSPFEGQFTVSPRSDATDDDFATPSSSLVVLEVAASDLAGYDRPGKGALALSAQRNDLMKHSFGPHNSTHRVLAVNKTTSSNANTIDQLAALLKDDLLAVSVDSVCFVEPVQTLASVLVDGGHLSSSIKRVIVLRTSNSGEQDDNLGDFTVPLTIKRVPGFGSASSYSAITRLSPDCYATFTKALDAATASTTEEACYVTHQVTVTAELALAACGSGDMKVRRVDSTLWTRPANIVDIASVGNVEVVDHGKLVRALKKLGVRDIVYEETQATGDEKTAKLYFQLPTMSSSAPVIRWNLASSAASCVDFVASLQKTIRDSLSLEDQEAFCRVACFIGSIVRTRLTNVALPAATTQLLCETAILSFFEHHPSSSTEQEGDTSQAFDHRFLWAKIVECLRWLSSWQTDQWIRVAEGVEAADELPLATTAALGELVRAVIQASSVDAETLNAVDSSEPRWLEMIEALLGGETSSERLPLPVVHKTILLKRDQSSMRSTLKDCDRAVVLSQRPEINPNNEMFVAVPSGLVPRHIRVSASSEELIDRVTRALQ